MPDRYSRVLRANACLGYGMHAVNRVISVLSSVNFGTKRIPI